MKSVALSLMLVIFTPILTLSNCAFAQEKALWIDVRTQQEFDAGHLKDAVLIPYNEIARKITAVETDKRRPINLYCRSGRRAEIALRTLEQLGYISVQNLGSFDKLKAQGVD